jgi:hypothetical protein
VIISVPLRFVVLLHAVQRIAVHRPATQRNDFFIDFPPQRCSPRRAATLRPAMQLNAT